MFSLGQEATLKYSLSLATALIEQNSALNHPERWDGSSKQDRECVL